MDRQSHTPPPLVAHQGEERAELDLTALNADMSSRVRAHSKEDYLIAYEVICPIIAGVDSLYFSCDLLLSGAMRERLAVEKVIAQGMGKPTPP